MNYEFKIGIYVLMSSEYNLDLYIPQERKDLIFFSRMKKEELSFIFEKMAV